MEGQLIQSCEAQSARLDFEVREKLLLVIITTEDHSVVIDMRDDVIRPPSTDFSTSRRA